MKVFTSWCDCSLSRQPWKAFKLLDEQFWKSASMSFVVEKTSSWSLQICFFFSYSVFQSYQWIREAKERAALSQRMRRGWGTRVSISSVLFKTQHNAKTEFNHYCNEWTFLPTGHPQQADRWGDEVFLWSFQGIWLQQWWAHQHQGAFKVREI